MNLPDAVRDWFEAAGAGLLLLALLAGIAFVVALPWILTAGAGAFFYWLVK